MHIFHFGNHSISLSDIRDIKLQYDYQKNEIYVDLELNGGAQMSLNHWSSWKNSSRKSKKTRIFDRSSGRSFFCISYG